jgi:tetratricopeptide (TPR) repeat protein
MMRAGLFGVAAVTATLAIWTMPAQAAGDTTPQCRQGLVWDAGQNKCVEPAPSASESETIYQQGRELAETGRYGEAIIVLSRLANGGDPRVLNYLGFAHRMEGRVRVGLGYYREALRIDPDHVLARAYMGEAFLQMGDLDAALAQLAEIEKRCGRDCHAYAELSAQIEAYRQEG